MRNKRYTRGDMLGFGQWCADIGVEAGSRGLGALITGKAISKWRSRARAGRTSWRITITDD